MGARQQHGFDYENHVIKKFGLVGSDNYLSKDDAYSIEKNGEIYPIQTKCIKLGSPIDMGSFERNRDKDVDFALVVGFWDRGIIGRELVEEHLLTIDVDWWKDLFKAPDGFYKDINAFLKHISNDEKDDMMWTEGCNYYKSVWKDSWKDYALPFSEKWGEVYTRRLIIPRFKRDHKNQKRIQCAIPNELFYKHFLRWA